MTKPTNQFLGKAGALLLVISILVTLLPIRATSAGPMLKTTDDEDQITTDDKAPPTAGDKKKARQLLMSGKFGDCMYSGVVGMSMFTVTLAAATTGPEIPPEDRPDPGTFTGIGESIWKLGTKYKNLTIGGIAKKLGIQVKNLEGMSPAVVTPLMKSELEQLKTYGIETCGPK